MNANTHLFLLYVDSLLEKKSYSLSAPLTLRSPELAHRINTVLRLGNGEHIQLFSNTCVITLALQPSPRPKELIIGTVVDCKPLTSPTYNQIVCIGLLKKESFEEAVHHATVTGATTIIPCITTKSRKSWQSPREIERLKTIIIAACEQSKNYYIPTLLDPQKLDLIIQNTPPIFSLGFEATGAPLTDALQTIAQQKPSKIRFFIGPEGGFTEQECSAMREANVQFYQLTPTILRSQEAVCLAGGLISSVKNNITRSS
jgi:16S rRNA (uracil1498-N3)-methyltransferase